MLEAVPRRGVSLFPLESRLARTVESLTYVAVRRLQGGKLRESKLHAFIAEVLGRRLEVGTWAQVRALMIHFGTPCARRGGSHEDWSEFFCSELVAEALQQLGTLDERVNSNDFLPNSFSMACSADLRTSALMLDACVVKGCSYGPEEMLLLPRSPLQGALRKRKKELSALRAAGRGRHATTGE